MRKILLQYNVRFIGFRVGVFLESVHVLLTTFRRKTYTNNLAIALIIWCYDGHPRIIVIWYATGDDDIYD
jgi:hypothetical protein